MRANTKIVVVALVAGALGVIAGLASTGPGPLLGSEFGQRLLNAVWSATAPEPPAGTGVARLGEPMPPLVLRDLAGQPHQLPAAYAGRPLLINLWASWCAPCVKEMPELQRFASEQAANGVQVIGIALDEPAAVRAFLARIQVGYPILLDTPGANDAGVRLGNLRGVLPYSVLVSADGRLLKQRIGPFDEGEIASWVQ